MATIKQKMAQFFDGEVTVYQLHDDVTNELIRVEIDNTSSRFLEMEMVHPITGVPIPVIVPGGVNRVVGLSQFSLPMEEGVLPGQLSFPMSTSMRWPA